MNLIGLYQEKKKSQYQIIQETMLAQLFPGQGKWDSCPELLPSGEGKGRMEGIQDLCDGEIGGD